jgi:hypothetical protein
MTVQIDVELNEQWRDDLAELKTEFQSMDGDEVDLDANIRPAQREIAELRTDLSALTDKEHKVKVDVDKSQFDEKIKSIKNLQLDDPDIDLGDVGDVDGSISITSDIDEDDPLISALLDDESELSTDGTVRWTSRGGYGPSSGSGVIHWDSDVDTTDLIQELEKAKKEAKAAGATEIDYKLTPEDGKSSKFLDAITDDRKSSTTNRTHNYEEYTNYTSRVDHAAFEDAKEEVEKLKQGFKKNGLNKITTEFCVERCDNWKENLQNIYKDLDALQEWQDENGEIKISLAGNLDEIEDTLDQLEESGFEPRAGGDETEVERMNRRANSGGTESQWEMVKEHLGIEDDDGSGGGDSDGPSKPGWTREDRKWMGGGISNAIVTEASGQLDRLDNTLDSLGIEGSVEGDRFTPQDISVTTAMEDRAIHSLHGESVANSPAANLHRKSDEVQETAQRQAFSDIVREYDKNVGNSYSGRDYSDHGEFDPFRNQGITKGSSGKMWATPDAIGNTLDKEHGTNPFTSRERAFLSRFGVDMKSSGFFGSDDDSSMADWFRSVSIRRTGPGGLGQFSANANRFKRSGTSNWGSILGFSGLPGFDSDTGKQKASGMGALKKLMPTMAKYWQFLALLSPMLITLAANAAGVAAAMGSIAVAGGAVVGLGLLGFGSNLNDSLAKAQKKLKTFKKEMFGAFQSTFQAFSPFTEGFLTTAPMRVGPLAESLKGLTEFMPTFNNAFDGVISWAAEFIDLVVKMQPMLSQLGMRFGKIIGDIMLKAFQWLTETAYKNQDVMIAVGEAIYNIITVLYQVAQVMTYLVAIFSPLIWMFKTFASFISERWVAAMIAGAMAVYGIATAVGVLSGAFSTMMATSFSSMASSIASFAATAITSFLAAAEALAVLIAGEATLMAMTGAGLALVAAGVTAGYMAYNAIAPSGMSSSLGGGSGAAPGIGGGVGGGGGSSGYEPGNGMAGGKTVINVKGDITKATISDVEDAVSKEYQSETTIESERNSGE